MNIEHYKSQIINTVKLRYRTLPDTDWDDIWQETLINLWKYPPSKLAYPLILVRVLCRTVDYIRTMSRKGFTNVPELEIPDVVSFDELENVIPDEVTPEDKAYMAELRAMFDQIPNPEERVAAKLHFIEGYSHQQVANELSVGLRTAERYASRGLIWVQQQVKGD